MDSTAPESPRFELQPFRAVRLADSLVGNSAANRFFARPYRSVAGRLRDWRRQRRIRVDASPALYVHEYTSAGVSVRGIVGALELASAGDSVVPHEDVEPGQVEQLAHRMEAMALNPAPIMLMHRADQDTGAIVQRTAASTPDVTFTDGAGQLHRIWRVADGEGDALGAALASARTVIADGHHRYAAAAQLHDAHPGTGWDRTLVMLVDQGASPLQLCAIHRTVRRLSLDVVEASSKQRGDDFRLHADRGEALARLDQALVLHDGTRWATLRPADASSLLVCALHHDLLPAWQVTDERLEFHHTAAAALARAGSGVSVLLPAPTYDQVSKSAHSGQLLPAKATSFQPKPHLGSIMRDLRDG